MADIRDAVFARLDAFTGLTALVASRIYPQSLPQNVTNPAVVFTVVSNVRISAMGADTGVARARVQVDCYDKTPEGSHAVKEQVRLALQRFRGTVASVEVLDVFVENEIDFFEDETELFRIAVDFEVIHRE